MTVSGNLVVLSPIEYRLLQVFMTNPDRAFSRAQLLDRVWGGDVYVEENRRCSYPEAAQGTGPNLESMIQTVRGTGYRFSTITLNPDRWTLEKIIFQRSKSLGQSNDLHLTLKLDILQVLMRNATSTTILEQLLGLLTIFLGVVSGYFVLSALFISSTTSR